MALYYRIRLPRPTSKVGAADHPWYEGGGKHWAYIVGWGSVAVQIELRLWRFAWGFTFWRSYGE